MKELLMVGSGSLIGGVSRYLLGGVIQQFYPLARFPLATFAVNFLGCLAIGIIAGWGEHHQLSASARLFLVTGLLGGFTTFSAFGLETVYLMRTGNVMLGVLNVALSVIICLSAVWIGNWAAGVVK
jgi:fluoride exporter